MILWILWKFHERKSRNYRNCSRDHLNTNIRVSSLISLHWLMWLIDVSPKSHQLNHLRLTLFSGKTSIVALFLNLDLTQVVEIFPCGRQWPEPLVNMKTFFLVEVFPIIKIRRSLDWHGSWTGKDGKLTMSADDLSTQSASISAARNPICREWLGPPAIR